MAKLRVERAGYAREGYTRTGGIRVKSARVGPSSFLIKDRGKLGRGQKVLPPLKKPGILGEGFFSKSPEQRHKILAGMARKEGERKAQGRMQWVSTMNMRTNPALSRKAASDRQWIARHFMGRRRV